MPEERVVGQSYGVSRGPYGCGASGLHWVIEPAVGERASCPCGTVVRFTSPDRYCAPNRCYCGGCPGYTPIPVIDYKRYIARMLEEKREAERRRQRELDRLSGRNTYQRRRRGS